ncbi:MAG: hypothetical protein JW810_14535 [Sedimentisphaerales bacterium]|nr:hypothetical protein [Sedimentisphaerales bacterium]
MPTYEIEKHFARRVISAPKLNLINEWLGLEPPPESQSVIQRSRIRIEPGQVVFLTGASGSGKTLWLRELQNRLDGAVDPARITLCEDRPVVECFAGAWQDVLYWLGAAGLGETSVLQQYPDQLSDGQRYRLRLALALAANPPAVVMDEFCDRLDRVTAAVVAHQIRVHADRCRTIFVAASGHDDLLEDLQPDVVVVQHLGGTCQVLYPGQMHRISES